MTNISKYLKRAVLIASVIWTAYTVLTFVWATSYSVLSADDFMPGAVHGLVSSPLSVCLEEAFGHVRNMYLGFQGCYFSMFIQALTSPVINLGMNQLRIMMVGNSALFFFSLFLFVWTVFRKMGAGREQLPLYWLVVAVISFTLVGNNAYPEVFFWYTGSTAYCFPLSLVFLGLVLILDLEKHRLLRCIAAILLGIMGMGGVLMITGMGCYLCLMVAVLAFIRHRKIDWPRTVVFLFWTAAAAVNAGAPGNFARHDAYDDTGIHLFQAVLDCVTMTDRRLQRLFTETSLPGLLFLILLCVILVRAGWETDLRSSAWMTGLLALLPFVTSFPVALGYASAEIPNRCEFLIDVSLLLFLVSAFLTFGQMIVSSVGGESAKAVLIAAGMAALACFMLDGYGTEDVVLFRITQELGDGTYRDHFYECKDFLSRLWDYERDSDVVLYTYEFPSYIDNLYNFYLTDNPKHFSNYNIAHHYGFKSVILLE